MTDSKTLPRIINVIGPIAIFAFNGYLWSLMFPSMQANPYFTTGIGTLLGIFAAYLEIRSWKSTPGDGEKKSTPKDRSVLIVSMIIGIAAGLFFVLYLFGS